MAELNQHDIITKQVLSQKTYAVDFLKNALPKEITSELDFTKLEIEKGNFIDATDQERFTDYSLQRTYKKAIRFRTFGIFGIKKAGRFLSNRT